MHKLLTILLIALLSCKTDPTTTKANESLQTYNPYITCTTNSCYGTYTGPEFIKGDDVAHQFSNQMSTAVGDQLKKLYKESNYSKVDFDTIEMSTKGMGTGTVTFYLKIPFKKVASACDAFTSFDHCGGWNHTPAIERRKMELAGVTLKNQKLHISELKTTPQGLQEYWIQWKNKVVQADCE